MATGGDSNSGGDYSGWSRWGEDDPDSGSDHHEVAPPPREWEAPPAHLLLLIEGFPSPYCYLCGQALGNPWISTSCSFPGQLRLHTSSPFPSENIIEYAVGPAILGIAGKSRQPKTVPKSQTGSAPSDMAQASKFDSNPEEYHSNILGEAAWMSQGHQAVLGPSLIPTNENAKSNAPTSPKGKKNCKQQFERHQALKQPIAQLTVNDLITNLSKHDLQITGPSDCPCEVDRWLSQRSHENACCCLCHLGEGVRAPPSWKNLSYTHYCEAYLEWVELRDRYDSMPCRSLFVDGEYVVDFAGHHGSDKDTGMGCSYDYISFDDVVSWVESESVAESQDDNDDHEFEGGSKASLYGTSDLPNPSSGDRLRESTLTKDHSAENIGVEALHHTDPIVTQAATPSEVANGNANESSTSSVVSAAVTQTQAETHAHQADQNTLVSGNIFGPVSVAWHTVVATSMDKVIAAARPGSVVSLFRRMINFIFSCLVAMAAQPSIIAKKINGSVLEFEVRLRRELVELRQWQKISKQAAIKAAALDRAIIRGYSTVANLLEHYQTFTDAADTTDGVRELSDVDEFVLWCVLLQIYTVLLFSSITVVEVVLTFLGLELIASWEVLIEWLWIFELLRAIQHT